MNNLLSIFSDSSVKPIQYHMEKVHEYSQLLPEILEAIEEQNWTQASMGQQQMLLAHAELNDIKQQIQMQLPASELLVSRAGILALLSEQNAIVNALKDVISLIVTRKMKIPLHVAENFYGFIYACLSAIEKARAVVDELEDLVASHGKGPAGRTVQKIMLELDQIGKETDQIYTQINAQMLAIEAELSPIDVMFLHKIFEGTNHIAEKAQQVGYRLQSLLQ